MYPSIPSLLVPPSQSQLEPTNQRVFRHDDNALASVVPRLPKQKDKSARWFVQERERILNTNKEEMILSALLGLVVKCQTAVMKDHGETAKCRMAGCPPIGARWVVLTVFCCE